MANARKLSLLNQPVLLVAVGIFTLYFARDLLIPLVLALTLSFLLTPLVNLLQKIGLGRIVAVALVLILSALAMAGVGWVVAQQLLTVAEDLPAYRLNIDSKLAELHAPKTGPLGQAIRSLSDIATELTQSKPVPAPVVASSRRRQAVLRNTEPNRVEIVPAPVSNFEYLRRFLRPMIRPLGTTLVIVVFTIFMMIKREDLRNRLLLLAGKGRINLMTQALDDAASRISRYLRMQFLVNGSYGLLFGLGLFWIGVPNATLWGVLAGILRLVPYLGTMVGAFLPICLSLAVFPSWWPTLWIVVLYGCLEIVIANFVEPWLYGKHTGISSLGLLVAAIFWTLLWGWAGLILSTPLTVCVIVLGRYVPQLSFLHIVLGDEAEMPSEAHFYQRLLAMDEREAHEIAIGYLQGKPLVELYDNVVLPALRLAEEDRHKGSLDEDREAFLFLSITELVAELSDYAQSPASNPAANEIPFTAPAAKDRPLVVCVAAKDQADEVSALMLAQLLEQAQFTTMVLVSSAMSEQLLQRLAQEPTTIVCISALPPFAFAQAKAVYLKIRAEMPANPIYVGMWGSSEELEKVIQRFGQVRPDRVFATLDKILEAITTETTTVEIDRAS